MIRIELILQIYAKPCSKVVDKINALLSNIWKFQFPTHQHMDLLISFQLNFSRKCVPQKEKWQRLLKLLHNCTYLTCYQGNAQNPSLGFNSTWTKNFQMYKLDLEKAENQKTNCQYLFDRRKSKGIPEKKHLLLLYWLCKRIDCVDHKKLWKTLKETGIPDHLPVSWETCLQVKKQQLAQDMKKQTRSKLEKEFVKAVCCHPAYLTNMQSTPCKIPGWMKLKLE